MKNFKFIGFCLIGMALMINSCKKDDSATVDLSELKNGVTTCEYAPYTLNSTFNYDTPNGATTWEVVGSEEINGKTFAKISGFIGSVTNDGFFNCENGEYSIYFSDEIPVFEGTYELIYLKENANEGDSWDLLVDAKANGITYQIRYEFTAQADLSEHTVAGNTYNNVKVVELNTYTIFSGFESLSSIDTYYWGLGVGLLEVDGLSVNQTLTDYNVVQ